MRFSEDNNYFKYCTVHSNPVEQYWYNQGMVILALLGIVVATTYHNDKWSHKRVNLKNRYNVGSSQENLTRSLFLIRVLFIQSPHGPCY